MMGCAVDAAVQLQASFQPAGAGWISDGWQLHGAAETLLESAQSGGSLPPPVGLFQLSWCRHTQQYKTFYWRNISASHRNLCHSFHGLIFVQKVVQKFSSHHSVNVQTGICEGPKPSHPLTQSDPVGLSGLRLTDPVCSWTVLTQQLTSRTCSRSSLHSSLHPSIHPSCCSSCLLLLSV